MPSSQKINAQPNPETNRDRSDGAPDMLSALTFRDSKELNAHAARTTEGKRGQAAVETDGLGKRVGNTIGNTFVSLINSGPSTAPDAVEMFGHPESALAEGPAAVAEDVVSAPESALETFLPIPGTKS